jgi:purine nucleosidase
MLTRRVVVDTDIGTDVDDMLALTMIFGEKAFLVQGVSTVYGDVNVRSRLARWVCESSGASDVRVASGHGRPLSDKPVWWAGHEGRGIPDLDTIDPGPLEKSTDLICETALEQRGELAILAIGPLTNVASALLDEPTLGHALDHIYVMGGRFDGNTTDIEHNFGSDPLAAWVVTHAGVPLTICGVEVTSRLNVGPAAKDMLQAAGPFGSTLADQMTTWWDFCATPDGSPPHDPLAALMIVRPDLFEFRTLSFDIQGEGAGGGRIFVSDRGTARARVVTDVDVTAAEGLIVDMIMANPGLLRE